MKQKPNESSCKHEKLSNYICYTKNAPFLHNLTCKSQNSPLGLQFSYSAISARISRSQVKGQSCNEWSKFKLCQSFDKVLLIKYAEIDNLCNFVTHAPIHRKEKSNDVLCESN